MSAFIVTVHSFMRGTGKSTLTARLGQLLSRQARVALIDGDLTTPSLSRLLGLTAQENLTVNDFLSGNCSAVETASELPIEWDEAQAAPGPGALFLVPASEQPEKLKQVARADMPFEAMSEGLRLLSDELQLDVILLDAAAGLSGMSLPLLAMADEVALALRLDQQDYQGTSVTLDVVRRLGVNAAQLIVNMVPSSYDLKDVEAQISATYQVPTTALALPRPGAAPDWLGLKTVGDLEQVAQTILAHRRAGPSVQ